MGVNIEMTPTVHYDHDVTLKIKIEVTSQSGSGHHQRRHRADHRQRVVDQVIRLREGEASILGGIQDKQDQVSWTGIPGLSSIPILKYLFGSKDHTITDDEIVFLVVPHIVRSQELDPANLRTIDTGAGQSIELRHISPRCSSNPRPLHRSSARQRPRMPCSRRWAPFRARARRRQRRQRWRSCMRRRKAMAQRSSAKAPRPPRHAPGRCELSLVAPPSPVAAGATFQVPIVLTGAHGHCFGSAAGSVRPGQALAGQRGRRRFSGPRRAGRGAGASRRRAGHDRPSMPRVRRELAGVSGAGVVCVLTFQAKAAGESAISHYPPRQP